jgi:hypothetical protein
MEAEESNGGLEEAEESWTLERVEEQSVVVESVEREQVEAAGLQFELESHEHTVSASEEQPDALEEERQGKETDHHEVHTVAHTKMGVSDESSPPEMGKRFSRFFMPEEYPYTASKYRHESSFKDEIPASPSTVANSQSLREGGGVTDDVSVAVVVTPESPSGPTILTQVSTFLRTSSVGWSDSDMSADSPIMHMESYNEPRADAIRAAEFDETPYSQPGRATKSNTLFISLPPGPIDPSQSPMVLTSTSDDRRTIASFLSKYDDHGTDIVERYAEMDAEIITESPESLRGTPPLHTPVDDAGDYTSCSEIPSSSRLSMYGPSADDHSGDEWTTSSDMSPESEKSGSNQRVSIVSIEVPDSPTTPRQTIELDYPLPPSPPPKDPPPPPPEKDQPVQKNSPVLSRSSSVANATALATPASESNYQPSIFLPEIETDPEPLGLAIQSLPSRYDFRPSFNRQSFIPEHYYSRPSMDHKYSYDSSRPSLDQKYSPSSSFNSEAESRRSSSFAGPSGHRYSETPPTSMATMERGSESVYSMEQKDSAEQKMLKKRRHLLKEIVDTESAFFRDMTVAEEIYKGSANACSSITPDDIKVLFGNTDAVVQFSKGFLEILKHAVSSVYILRRGRSGLNSSTASMTNSMNSDEQKYGGPPEELLSEEDKDRKTYVGEAFAEVMYRLEKVYGDYCKNHDNALSRLQALQTNTGVAIWLQECKACAEDLTNAWNLESLLIKPVQRVLKYPLLLTQLFECTPPDHPDYKSLEIATKEMKFAADRINEMKKRKDMVEKIVGRKRNETDIRHGISKGFARRAEKLRQSVGLSEVVVDETYNRLFQSYNMHFVQVQVITRDIEIYASDIQSHVDRFIEFSSSFKEFGEVVPTQHPEMEAKWRRFDSAIREIANTYLLEHVSSSAPFHVRSPD